MSCFAPYLGVVLAGGYSRRMGHNKALVEFGGVRLVDYVSRRLLLQLDDVVINTPLDMYCGEGVCPAVSLPLVGDIAPFVGLGPLSGLHAALCYIQVKNKPYEGVITIAVDTPFFPNDYVARLCDVAALYPQRVVIAASGGTPHPTFALWPRSVEKTLKVHLQQGDYAILSFARQVGVEFVDFPINEQGKQDVFFNINTPQDLQLALRCGEKK